MRWKTKTENTEVEVLPDTKTFSRAAAGYFARLAREASELHRNRFTVALAGGSTPKSLYRLLANESEPFCRQVDWGKINFFWGDERCVAPDSEESNFRMANENLLRPLGISPMNFHRMEGELDAPRAVANYEKLLRLFFNVSGADFPRFDLVLLGMGADGHTASLFPGTEVLSETRKFVAAPWVEKFGAHRLTLTPPVINNAAHVVFLVAGADKAPAFREVVEGEFEPNVFPAQLVRPANGKLLFLADEAAAQLVSPRTINAKAV